MLIATHSGLRGRPGFELTEEVVSRAVGGFTELLRSRELPASVAVARDDRPEGGALAARVVATLLERGVDVVDFGAVSTPTAKLAARVRGAGGAVVVTGSHLAPAVSGLKFALAPHFVPVDVRELLKATDDGTGSQRRGRLRADAEAARDHAAAVCGSVDAEAVRRARLRVACTGGAGRAAALVLEGLGCEAARSRADVGLLLDPDGDRLRLVDEGGRALEEEATLALVVVARDARTVVKGADTSRMVDDLTARGGGTVRLVPPGELHLVKALVDCVADLAGEGNGGVVVPGVGLARDGLAAAAAILELCARTGRAISGLAADLPVYARRRSTVPCAGRAQAWAALEALAIRLGVEVGHPDEGVRIERPDGSWGLVRQSATEPVLRITAEATTEAVADRLHEELRVGLEETALPT